MRVVSLVGFRPPPRYDNQSWTRAIIEESQTENGPWSQRADVAISADADPKNPSERNFTIENAQFDDGWYRIKFTDSTGDDSAYSTSVHDAERDLAFLPSVAEVANLIRSRTKDRFGNEIGTFNADTRPTGEAASAAIRQASSDVTMAVDTDIPEGAYEYVRQAIASRAAMIIERSYYAEQINNNRSPYPQLKDDYDYLMGTPDQPGFISRAVEREAQEAITGEAALTNRPSYSFPDPELRYKLGRPL